MQVAIFANKEGGVSILVPILNKNIYSPTTEEWRPLKKGETIPEGFRYPTIEEVADKDVPEGTPYIIMDDSELPDRSKREAWVLDGGQVVIDEAKVITPSLSERLEAILKDSGELLASEQNPTPELLALVDGIMTIDTKLSNLSDRFGGDSPLYKAAAIAYLNELGVLPENLEPARQAMLAECEA